MGQMINVNIRMDEELKKQADYLFNELGLNMSAAVNMFVRQAVRNGGIPFEVTMRTDGGRQPFSVAGRSGTASQADSQAATPAASQPAGQDDLSGKTCDPAEP